MFDIETVFGCFFGLQEITDDAGHEEAGAARPAGGGKNNRPRAWRRWCLVGGRLIVLRRKTTVLTHPQTDLVLKRYRFQIHMPAGHGVGIDKTYRVVVTQHQSERGTHRESADQQRR